MRWQLILASFHTNRIVIHLNIVKLVRLILLL